MLSELGAKDVRAGGRTSGAAGAHRNARMLYEMAGSPPAPKDAVMGPCKALNPEGLAFVLEIGGGISDQTGDWRAPIALLLETYSRNPEGKHRCLELMVEHGITLPDTPPMAVHRGRLDLLERHLGADPSLLRRTFSHTELFPPELGCGQDGRWRLSARRLAGRRSCTCASITANSRSPSGCSTAAWT